MIHPRKFIINFTKFLIGEHHQYSHSNSFKSLLLETKLKNILKNLKILGGLIVGYLITGGTINGNLKLIEDFYRIQDQRIF